MSTTDQLIGVAEYYAATFDQGHLPARPALGAAVLTCMDARLDVYKLLGLARGEVHVLRNAGGVVTQDVLRSLAISQRKLGTQEVIIIQHTRCGLGTFEDADFRSEIARETGVRPLWSSETFADLDANVLESVARVAADPSLLHPHAVRGFVYDVDCGSLREVREVRGAVRASSSRAVVPVAR